jgi:hypothetical protein
MKTLEYSPPHGGWPQELPDYYRYPNGVVRTDLKQLSHDELLSLGWYGPHERPIPRVLENVEKIEGVYNQLNSTFIPETEVLTEITDGWISKSGDGIFSAAIYNPEDNSIQLPENISFSSGPAYFITTFTDAVQNYDYNPEIEKWDWDDTLRQYVIINLAQEEPNRPVPPTEPPTPQPTPDWNSFERIVLQSPEMNQFIIDASEKNALVATAFPAAFYEAKNGNYDSFRIVWEEITKLSIIDGNVLLSFVSIASSLNLPQEFISILNSN